MLWNTFNTKIPMVILMVYLLGYDESSLGLLKRLICFIYLVPLKDLEITSLVLQVLGELKYETEHGNLDGLLNIFLL